MHRPEPPRRIRAASALGVVALVLGCVIASTVGPKPRAVLRRSPRPRKS